MKDPFQNSTTILPDIQPLQINAGGLRVDVWGFDRLNPAVPDSGVVVMFLLHGRLSSVAECESPSS
jgi:hypothetical protein